AATTSIGALLRTVMRMWLWLPALAGVAMLVVQIASPPRDDRGELLGDRWGWAMLALSFVIAGPLLAAKFNLPPAGLGLYVCQRFHLLPALLLAIPVAVALDRWGGALVEGRVASSLGHALALAGFGALVVVALPRLRAAHSPAMELGVRNTLRALPDRAVA